MADNPNPSSPLPDVFSPATRDWFLRAFKQPTAVQSQTWHVAARGEHALVIAPTGSGKTLAAFLYALDRLFREGGEDTREAHKRKTSRILYISPIKALGTDVQRNLQIPLQGIADERRRRGETEVNLRVGIRTGDTPAQERSKLTRNPPDILITTPESLYLMLTSRARETLRGVETVIIDEVHAVAGSKRGAHLALSLERLDALLHTSAQRIGLSATVRSASDVAAFLGGDRPVTVVNPPAMVIRRYGLSYRSPIWMMSHRSPAALAKTAMPDGKAPSGHILKRVSLMKCCAIARPLSLLIRGGWRKN